MVCFGFGRLAPSPTQTGTSGDNGGSPGGKYRSLAQTPDPVRRGKDDVRNGE